jgi:hypothetical protein
MDHTRFREQFEYLSPFKVLVCKPCKHGILQTNIHEHLRSTHNVKKKLREEILRSVDELELLLLPPQDVPPPPLLCPQFPELLKPVAGFRCIGCKVYVTTSKDNIVSHCGSTTRRAQCPFGKGWETTFLQRFFKSKRYYFPVTPSDEHNISELQQELQEVARDLDPATLSRGISSSQGGGGHSSAICNNGTERYLGL